VLMKLSKLMPVKIGIDSTHLTVSQLKCLCRPTHRLIGQAKSFFNSQC
jgi:hypothetical protein